MSKRKLNMLLSYMFSTLLVIIFSGEGCRINRKNYNLTAQCIIFWLIWHSQTSLSVSVSNIPRKKNWIRSFFCSLLVFFGQNTVIHWHFPAQQTNTCARSTIETLEKGSFFIFWFLFSSKCKKIYNKSISQIKFSFINP